MKYSIAFIAIIFFTLNCSFTNAANTELIESEVETAFRSIRSLFDNYFDGKANQMARTFGSALKSTVRSIFSGGVSSILFAASLAVGAITMLSFFESPISPLPVPPLPKPPVGRFPPEHPIWPPIGAAGVRHGQESALRPVYAHPNQPIWSQANRRNHIPSPPIPQQYHPGYSHISYRPYFQLNNNLTSLNDLNAYSNRRKIADDSGNVDDPNKVKANKLFTVRNGPLITYNSTKALFNTPRSFGMPIQKRNDYVEDVIGKPEADNQGNANEKPSGLKE